MTATELVGGIRARLIRDSVFYSLQDGLTALGWFEDGRHHLPIKLAAGPVNNTQEIAFNTVALSDENLSENELEMGSNAVETAWTFYVDFYAESDVLGRHLINDVRDLLAGRFPSIGRADSSIQVYDYRLATPAVVFVVQIESILVDRAHDFPKAWQQHWYACTFIVRDSYS